jgi:nicotinamide-nucleotide amidase
MASADSRLSPGERANADKQRRSVARAVFLTLLTMMCCVESAHGTSANAMQTDYMIVVTGAELLTGVYADGHTHFLTRTLRPLGFRCVSSISVDDKQEDILEAMEYACGKASLVIVTGGLGPTDTDITRETLAQFTDVSLREDPGLLHAMERRFHVPAARLRGNLRRQTLVPTQGRYLHNAGGTAVGLVFEPQDKVVVALPGPPRELQTMVREHLIPYLSARFGTRKPGCSLTLRFVGVGQSQIESTLDRHVLLPPDVSTASQFHDGRVDYTFSLPEDTPDSRKQLEQLKQRILQHLRSRIYADDATSLEECVIRELASRRARLALVEVASGGQVAAALSRGQGAQQVLAGGIVAQTDQQLQRMLHVPDAAWTNATMPAERVQLLAATAADACQADWAMVIGQAETQNGVRQLPIAVRSSDGQIAVQRISLHRVGTPYWQRLTTQLLDCLRQQLTHRGHAGRVRTRS